MQCSVVLDRTRERETETERERETGRETSTFFSSVFRLLPLSYPREFLRYHCTRIDEGVENRIHGLLVFSRFSVHPCSRGSLKS